METGPVSLGLYDGRYLLLPQAVFRPPLHLVRFRRHCRVPFSLVIGLSQRCTRSEHRSIGQNGSSRSLLILNYLLREEIPSQV
jgi:hypothetical protein